MVHEWWVAAVYAGLPVFTIVLTIIVSYWVSETRDFRGERLFLVMHGWAILWLAAVTAHILSSDPTLMRWIVRLELGIAMVEAAMWLVFCSQYADAGLHRRRWVHLAFVASFVWYATLILTNPDGLMFHDIVVYTEPFTFASAERGPLYLLTLLIPYSMALGGIVVLVQFLFSTRRGARARMLLLVFAVLSILLFNTLSILDLAPVPEFEHASYGLLPFMVFMVIGLFRLGFLEIEPVARDKLVETLDDGMVVVDADRRIIDYNPRITDLEPSIPDHVGEPLETVFPDLAELLARPDEGRVVTDHVPLDTEEGQRHYSVRVSPLTPEGSGGDLLGYSVLLRDVTELERSRRELERQNEQLDQFAGIVSHDLRNPLNVAEGYTGIVETDLDGLANAHDVEVDHVRERLHQVDQAHDRMGAIIDDILTLTREGKSVEETARLDFASVARDAWGNVDTGDATLTIETGGTIEADRSRLLTVFENLFRNAIDHVGPTVAVTIGLTEDGFYVADDGPGIPEERVDHVFEYGYTTSSTGTGLGLSIVETMAGSHGWTVDLRTDDPDAGIRFVFAGVYVEPAAEVPGEDAPTPDSVGSHAG